MRVPGCLIWQVVEMQQQIKDAEAELRARQAEHLKIDQHARGMAERAAAEDCTAPASTLCVPYECTDGPADS